MSVVWLMGLTSVAAFFLAAFFAGSETAIIACDRVRIRHLAGRGDKRAVELLRLIESPQYFLSLVLVGTNVAVIACTSAFTAIIVEFHGASGATVATVILVPLLLVFEEIIPKGVFLYYADKAALQAVYPLRFFGFLLYPITISLSGLSSILMRIFRGGVADPAVRMTAEELLFHLQDSREAGLIPKDTLTLASRAFDLMDLKAADVMLPIDNVVMVKDGLDTGVYQKVFADTRFTRLPVYRGARTNVIGILSIQGLLKTRGPLVDIPVLEGVYDVGMEEPISRILMRMKNQGCHMAMVRGDDGTVVGMTTLEDILERLVGAISDEFH